MTYDRNEGRRYGSDPRSRYASERDDRGFFDRARDEVSSWFGDERAESRRDRDERFDDGRRRPFMGERDYGRSDHRGYPEDGYRRPHGGSSLQQFGDEYGPTRAYQNDRWDRGQTQSWERQRDFTGSASGLPSWWARFPLGRVVGRSVARLGAA